MKDKKVQNSPAKNKTNTKLSDPGTNQSKFPFPDNRERRDGPGGEDGDAE